MFQEPSTIFLWNQYKIYMLNLENTFHIFKPRNAGITLKAKQENIDP